MDYIWPQFGAAIDMLENAIAECPENVWTQNEFWYIAYHTAFWLDAGLSESMEHFAPPAPFTLSEADPAGVMPDRIYTKEEVLGYIKHGRAKCFRTLESLDPNAPRRFNLIESNGAEVMLYSLRHVQHHAAQLNLLLRQAGVTPPRWVSRAKNL
jgi:DinB superfamily